MLWYVYAFWDLGFRIQTSEAGSRSEISRRIRIWYQKIIILVSGGGDKKNCVKKKKKQLCYSFFLHGVLGRLAPCFVFMFCCVCFFCFLFCLCYYVFSVLFTLFSICSLASCGYVLLCYEHPALHCFDLGDVFFVHAFPPVPAVRSVSPFWKVPLKGPRALETGFWPSAPRKGFLILGPLYRIR